MTDTHGSGTVDDPWVLRTPPGSSDYQMYRDEEAGLEHNPRNNRMRAV